MRDRNKYRFLFSLAIACVVGSFFFDAFASFLRTLFIAISIVGGMCAHIRIPSPLGQFVNVATKFATGCGVHLVGGLHAYMIATGTDPYRIALHFAGILVQVSIAFRWRQKIMRTREQFRGLSLRPRGTHAASSAYISSFSCVHAIMPVSTILSWRMWTSATFSDARKRRKEDGVVRVKNVVYARRKDYGALTLDIWFDASAEPPNDMAHKPVLLYWHGGAWTAGDKCFNPQNALLVLLARQGFVVVSASYRKAPRHRWDDIFDDAKDALRWVVHSGQLTPFRASPDVLFLAGSSAGGHIAATIINHVMRTASSSSVHGVVLFYPPLDMTNETGAYASLPFSIPPLRYRKNQSLMEWWWYRWVLGEIPAASDRGHEVWSPLNQFASDCPPMLIVHGDMDGVVPCSVSEECIKRIRSHRTRCSSDMLISVPGQRHAFDDFWNPTTRVVLDGIAAWLHRELP